MTRNTIIIVSIFALFIIVFLYLSLKADNIEIQYLKERVRIQDSVQKANYLKQNELILELTKNNLDARHYIDEYVGRVTVTKDSIDSLENEIIRSDEKIKMLIQEL